MEQIIIYDLKNQGLKFKSDFNQFKRIKKIFDQRTGNSYYKIDLVTDKSKKIYLINRIADFDTNEAKMKIEEINLK